MPIVTQPIKASAAINASSHPDPLFKDYCIHCGDKLFYVPCLGYSDNQKDTCFLCEEEAEYIAERGATLCRCCLDTPINKPGFCGHCLSLPGGVG